MLLLVFVGFTLVFLVSCALPGSKASVCLVKDKEEDRPLDGTLAVGKERGSTTKNRWV